MGLMQVPAPPFFGTGTLLSDKRFARSTLIHTRKMLILLNWED